MSNEINLLLHLVAVILNIVGLFTIFRAIPKLNYMQPVAEWEQMMELKDLKKYSQIRKGILIVLIGFIIELVVRVIVEVS